MTVDEKKKTNDIPSTRYGSVEIYDHDWDGIGIKHDNGYSCRVSGDDMLDYEMDENISPRFLENILTKEELEFVTCEYRKIRSHAKHRGFYDAYDNTWKDPD